MKLSPVILFAYNRPDLLRMTLESLSRNELADQSVLYIYCDGPKDNATPAQLEKINEVRKVAASAKWCKEVNIIASEKNKGLARSVISGVTETVNREGKVIIVEDDILLSKYFLRFMNDALDKYENDERVLSIGSWNYFCDPEKLKDNFFMRYPDSIAWATFKRAWNLFEHDSKVLIRKLQEKNLLNDFNCGIPEKYFEPMLVNQVEGKIDSWAIRWTATSVLNGKLNIYPRYSLSKHMGFVSDATHESDSKDYNSDLQLATEPIVIADVPVAETKEAIDNWKAFIVKEFIHRKSFLQKAVYTTKRIIISILYTLFNYKGKR